jgi:WD40 repeat protein/tRNA A-37 threonylcarbamoyl transferase component Bud32
MLARMSNPAAGARDPAAPTIPEEPKDEPSGPPAAAAQGRPGPFTSGGAPVHVGSPQDPLTREDTGRYEVRREFARGGQAIVYLAYDRHIGRDVALKQLLPQHVRADRPPTRFLREARVTGQLEHPSIVPVYELGQRADGTHYYTQKLVRGRTLYDALCACRTLADRLKLLAHFVDVCQAIAYAHGRGVVHRDIKPENVMVGEFGETVVLDWGLAKVRSAREMGAEEPTDPARSAPGQTAVGTVLGTPLYMSPEQAQGRQDEVDERSDVWSLGALLYEILTGRPPHLADNSAEVLRRVLHEPVPPVLSLCAVAPPELVAVADRALQREKGRRYGSARELAAEIEAWMSGARVRAYEYSSWELVRRFVAKNRLLTAVGAAGLAVLIASTILIAREHRASRAHLLEARRNLGEALLEKARAAERALQWPRAAALYAAARIERPAGAGRWGQALTAQLGPVPLARIDARQGAVWAVQALPDGKRLATAGDDGTVRLWNLGSGAELERLGGHRGQVTSLAASADGRALASAGIDGTVRLWDLGTGKGRVLGEHEDEAWCVALSRDGALVASGGLDDQVRLWDARSGRALAALPHGERVTALAFGPRGELASASFDGTARVWLGPDWHEVARLALPGAQLWALALSPDGRDVALGDAEGALRLWRIDGSRRPIALDGHDRVVSAAAFSPDGGLLASAGWDGTVRLWDAGSGRGLARIDGHQRAVSAVAFAPDGRTLVSAGEDLSALLWSLPSPRPLRSLLGHTADARAVAFAPDGRALASGGEDSTVRLWDPQSGREIGRAAAGGWVRAVAFSPDGALLAGASDDERVHVWDARTLAERAALAGHSDEINGLAFGPGALLASASNDGNVRLWDASAGRALRTIAARQGKLRAVALSPDGKLLASSGTDLTVRLWDPASGELRAVLRGHDGRVRALRFSPDGAQLASGGNDRDVILWDLSAHRMLRRLEGHEGQVRGLAFTPDGRALASGSADRSVQLWDVQTGEPLVRLLRHEREVMGIALSPDGALLASAGRDGTLELVHLGDAQQLPPPEESLRALLARFKLRRAGLSFEEEAPPAPKGTFTQAGRRSGVKGED